MGRLLNIEKKNQKPTFNMDTIQKSFDQQLSVGQLIRLKLIIAFNGDVPKADIALKFINNAPEALFPESV